MADRNVGGRFVSKSEAGTQAAQEIERREAAERERQRQKQATSEAFRQATSSGSSTGASQDAARRKTPTKSKKNKRDKAKGRHSGTDSPRVWSTRWAVFGVMVGAIWAFTQFDPENRWVATAIAAVVVGGVAGRFYKIIMGIGVIAGVLFLFSVFYKSDESTDKAVGTTKPSTDEIATPPQSTENAAIDTKLFEEWELAEQKEKAKDQARTSPYPPAPDTTGVLFQHDEFDIFVNKLPPVQAYVFHVKVIDHDSISHLEYHYQDNWVAVVFKTGQRLDLGAHIQWLVRPYWRLAKEIHMVRTKDGNSLEGKTVPLIKVGEAT